MSAPRFFLDESFRPASGAEVVVPLSAEDLHHAVRVSRIRPGEIVVVVSPDARCWHVEVTRISAHEVAGVVTACDEQASPPLQVVLFQGVAKGDKMDAIVRQSVEVGVSEIVPVITGRTVVRLDGKKSDARVARWRKIALSAAQQAGRGSVPAVHDVVAIADAAAMIADFDRAWALWEESGPRLLGPAVRRAVSAGARRVALVVGPEGGLDTREVELLASHGCEVASLGPFILRTETAAVVSTALAIAAALEVAVD